MAQVSDLCFRRRRKCHTLGLATYDGSETRPTSNRLSRDIDDAIYAGDDKDETYSYDGLHRLKGYARGTLSGGSIATPNFEQDWTLSQLGNWEQFVETTGGSTTLDQTRTHNDANEITGISETTGPTWIDPVYDAAGNMIEAPSALAGDQTTKHKYIYDAWNQLVKVTDASGVSIGEYEYDGLKRRIVKKIYAGGVLAQTLDLYFNYNWQIVEIYKDGDPDPLKSYMWHTYYIDAPAFRYYDADLDGNYELQYFIHDANFNVTALIDTSGAVLERYEHTPYGQVTILDDDFSDDADNTSDYEQDVLFQGTQHDAESGLHLARYRYLQWPTGRWTQWDFSGYVDGMNAFAAYHIMWSGLDPLGLAFNLEVAPAVQAYIDDHRNDDGPRGERARDWETKVTDAKASLEKSLEQIRNSDYGKDPNNIFNKLDKSDEVYTVRIGSPQSTSSLDPGTGIITMRAESVTTYEYIYEEQCLCPEGKPLKDNGKFVVVHHKQMISQSSLLVHEITHLNQLLEGRLDALTKQKDDSGRWEDAAEKEAVEEANRFRGSVGENLRSAYHQGYFQSEEYKTNHKVVEKCPK